MNKYDFFKRYSLEYFKLGGPLFYDIKDYVAFLDMHLQDDVDKANEIAKKYGFIGCHVEYLHRIIKRDFSHNKDMSFRDCVEVLKTKVLMDGNESIKDNEKIQI